VKKILQSAFVSGGYVYLITSFIRQLPIFFRYLLTIAQSAGIDFTPDPKVMRDDEDEIVRAERNLINFMNEVEIEN
jgi:hypothetical protein